MNQKGTEGGLVLHIFMTIFPRNLWSLGKGEIVCLTKCLTRYLFKSRIVFVQMPKCICLVLPGLWVIWEAPGGGDPSGDQTEFTTCAHDNLRHCILSSFPAKEVSRLLFGQKKISQQQDQLLGPPEMADCDPQQIIVSFLKTQKNVFIQIRR